MADPVEVIRAALLEFDASGKDEAFAALAALQADLAEARQEIRFATTVLDQRSAPTTIRNPYDHTDMGLNIVGRIDLLFTSLEARLNEAQANINEYDELLDVSNRRLNEAREALNFIAEQHRGFCDGTGKHWACGVARNATTDPEGKQTTPLATSSPRTSASQPRYSLGERHGEGASRAG